MDDEVLARMLGRLAAIEATVGQMLALSEHDLDLIHERASTWLEAAIDQAKSPAGQTAPREAREAARNSTTMGLDRLFLGARAIRATLALPDQGHRKPPREESGR